MRDNIKLSDFGFNDLLDAIVILIFVGLFAVLLAATVTPDDYNRCPIVGQDAADRQ